MDMNDIYSYAGFWFSDYVSSFYNPENVVETDIFSERELHCCRVADYCGQIAESIGLSKDDIVFAKMCGLLHDVGRFLQWRDYCTFSDCRSVDHACLSADILKDSFFYSFIDERSRRILDFAVREHNKLSVVCDDEDSMLFCSILRDADQLDIYRFFFLDYANEYPEGRVSDKVVEDFNSGRIVNTLNVCTRSDKAIVLLSWFFAMNYGYTRNIIVKRGYIGMLEKIIGEDVSRIGEKLSEIHKYAAVDKL